MTPALLQILFGETAPVVDLDFARGFYRLGNQRPSKFLDVPGASFTRASAGYAGNNAGLLIPFASGEPRITDKGLLVEEARTNYVTNSQALNAWSLTNITSVSPTGVTAPDGTNTGNTITESTSTSNHLVSQGQTVSSGATVSVSAFLAAGTRRYVQVGFFNNSVTGFVWVTVDTQSWTITEATASGIGVYSSSSIAQRANGFYYVTVVGSLTGASGYNPFIAGANAASGAGGAPSYTGTSSTIIAWQVDMQVGSFPTSPITTTSAAVTRAADVALIDSLSVLAPFTLYAQASYPTDDAAAQKHAANLGQGSDTNNRAILFRGVTGNGVIQGVVAGSAQINVALAQSGAVTFASAVSQDGATWRGAIAGSIQTSASGSGYGATPLTRLSVGGPVAGVTYLNGYVKRIAAFRSAYTDAQLQALTAA